MPMMERPASSIDPHLKKIPRRAATGGSFFAIGRPYCFNPKSCTMSYITHFIAQEEVIH